MTRQKFCASVVAWVVTAGTGWTMCRPMPLSIMVEEYHARNLPLIEALYELGRAEGICFGIEVMDEALLREHVDRDRKGIRAGTLLKEIMSVAEGLHVVERDSVLIVRRTATPRHNWLDFRIPAFRSRQDEVQSVSNVLYMTMVSAADFSIKGFAGSYAAGDPEDRIGPFSENGKSVAELLSLLLRNSSRGGMWLVEGEAAFTANIPKRAFWTILSYGEPVELNRKRLRWAAVSASFPTLGR